MMIEQERYGNQSVASYGTKIKGRERYRKNRKTGKK